MKSQLCIFDLATGGASTVLDCDRRIEAPNWTRDGAALLVNGDGRLWRVPLDAPALHPVDTGGLHRLNNDHGLSPDGATLALSDKTHTPQSCIWLMPLAGGAPRRLTPETPSWWHGWSPDGARVAYACVRDGQFGIATRGVEGGPEALLVCGPHHYDGPDYTADGAWIWFNSDRGGTMQLWRIRPDGTGVEQGTDGPRDAWFPHPAPDGRHVLYLAYPPGTEGHPADVAVELRLHDIAAGTCRPLLALRGGQGTLNVPPWAPDGRRFAFVCSARP